MKIKESIRYEYKNVPIIGGGYVTGLIYHQKKPGILYARTDIGGTYRFNSEEKRWYSLIDHVTHMDLAETYPIALALDDEYPERLYIVCGMADQEQGVFCISEDYGESFIYKKMPTKVHGNLSGRGTGYRLVVDKNDSNTLYFASQLGGLFKTTDRGDSWSRMPLEENYMTFVWVSGDSKTIVVGTAGYTTRVNEALRGHSLYVSYDGGLQFEKLMQPENFMISDSRMNGLVASRCDYDGKYLYVTMQSTGRSSMKVDLGYSCDTGDVIAGKVLRYYFENGRITGFDDITPDEEGEHTAGYLNYGFGGVCSCPAMPGLVVCSTLCKEKESPECVYISRDYGEHWKISLRGLEEGDIFFRAPYMQPRFNGNVSILHWLSDVKINPFNPNEMWFNSGTGVFTTDNLLSEHPNYHDYCDGIEETVHLNVYAPLNGDVQLVGIVGDLGGFAFQDLDKPCENSFDDKDGNRYITCINADISDENSDLGVIMARGNWKGKTKGGLIRTKDGFRTFERIDMPFYLGGEIAERLHIIEQPNINPGWVAMSQNGDNMVWSVALWARLPVSMVIVTKDAGKTFSVAKIYDLNGEAVTEGYFKAFSDRCNNDLFYGFGEEGQVYISKDGGLTFHQRIPLAQNRKGEKVDFPKCDFGYIDTVNKTEVRGVAGEQGLFYLALAREGLWKLQYDLNTDSFHAWSLMDVGDVCFRVGLGVGRIGGQFVGEPKAIYFNGSISGKYGFYRTLDECQTYSVLNTKRQMYGQINSIDADKRVFGRFFLATGSRGLLYGEPLEG